MNFFCVVVVFRKTDYKNQNQNANKRVKYVTTSKKLNKKKRKMKIPLWEYIKSSDENLAEFLGGTSVGDLLDISEDVFEDAGQSEPLISRLKNILGLHGLAIFKELLQNADDAEAAEVNVCYDARQH